MMTAFEAFINNPTRDRRAKFITEEYNKIVEMYQKVESKAYSPNCEVSSEICQAANLLWNILDALEHIVSDNGGLIFMVGGDDRIEKIVFPQE